MIRLAHDKFARMKELELQQLLPKRSNSDMLLVDYLCILLTNH